MDEQIDALVVGLELFTQADDAHLVAEVAGQADGVRRGWDAGAIDADHRGAGAEQMFDHGSADAAATAGDQCLTAGQGQPV